MFVACATDDGIKLIKNHFGDAAYFNIYNVKKESFSQIESIENNITSDSHADPRKAKQILQLLKGKGVHVLMNKAFGPNITKIKHLVLPLVISEDLISKAIKRIQDSFPEINEIIDNKRNCYLTINKDGKMTVVNPK